MKNQLDPFESSEEVTESFHDQDIVNLAKSFLYRTMMAKTELCRDSPMSDAPPIFLVSYKNNDDDDSLTTGIAPLTGSSDSVYDALVEVVNHLEIKPFHSVTVILEGYVQTLSDDEKTNGVEKGFLENDFKNNPFSTVKESVVICVKDWDSPYHINCVITYAYDDAGLPVYDEPVWSENKSNESGDRMPEVLGMIVNFIKYRLDTDEADS